MSQTETIDWFATRDDDSYRDEARNILDSYAHPWDVLAELAQNSVDAIDQVRQTASGQFTGTINIDLDPATRTITFFDNGVGISNADLRQVLKPHFSRKRGKLLRGEKGVGLTYVALVGNDFSITTKHAGQVECARVKGPQTWLQSQSARPKITIEPAVDKFPNLQSYTEVKVGDVPELPADNDELDIFALNHGQLSHILRTRTAIGYTGPLFGIKSDIKNEVLLTVHGKDGTITSKSIPFAFESPAEHLPKKATISLEEVRQHLANSDQKRVLGRPIFMAKVYSAKNGKDIRAYCLITSRHLFNELNQELNLPEDVIVQGGVYIATKGMPTGILLPTPKTGRASYWPNFFIVLEYDHVTLDLGRKSITAPRTIEMLSKQASQIFNDLLRYVRYSVAEDEGTLDALESSDELQDELARVKNEAARTFRDNRGGSKLPEVYPFTREPKQEQDVVAIFSMALARGLLPYELLRLSTNYRYDGFLRLKLENKFVTVVAEFKLVGESLLRDLEDAKARYGQLHLLICWSMDEARLRQAGFIVDEIEGGKRELPGATHKLSFPVSSGIKDQPIAVICLSELFVSEE